MIAYTGPVAMITGRKNTALANVLPLNFWLTMIATNMEKIMITGRLKAISFRDSTRYCLKVGSVIKALL